MVLAYCNAKLQLSIHCLYSLHVHGLWRRWVSPAGIHMYGRTDGRIQADRKGGNSKGGGDDRNGGSGAHAMEADKVLL